MPVTVVVGGQFGSEGKGKVAHYLAKEMGASVAIRCGGPNSGHTVIDPNGNPIIFQQLPTASILPEISIVLCAGMYVDVDILLEEIQISNLSRDRLFIDPNAVIITPEIKKAEIECGLIGSIGSTGSGTGEAVIQRVRRQKKMVFAKDIDTLSCFIKDTKAFMRNQLCKGNRVILEGTQGYGLSLLHSPFYPHVTSRDTTAAGFLSEAGLSPIDVDDVVLTLRAFPIRVNGNSGPLPKEIDWHILTEESGSTENLIEYSSVSNKIRRVARFDKEIVKQAIATNNPSKIILNHIDYIDSNCINKKTLTEKAISFIKEMEFNLRIQFTHIGNSPSSTIPTRTLVFHQSTPKY